MARQLESALEYGIFWSRWLQVPMYVGLIIAQVAYCYIFGTELWHLLMHTTTWNGKLFLGGVLELIDFLMVANLITMVAIGGYATFVSKLDIGHHDDRPDWLDHIDPGSIKVKLAGSLIGISSIHLLQSFIQIGDAQFLAGLATNGLTIEQVYTQIQWQIVLHIVFLFSTLMLACTEMVMARRNRAEPAGAATAHAA